MPCWSNHCGAALEAEKNTTCEIPAMEYSHLVSKYILAFFFFPLSRNLKMFINIHGLQNTALHTKALKYRSIWAYLQALLLYSIIFHRLPQYKVSITFQIIKMLPDLVTSSGSYWKFSKQPTKGLSNSNSSSVPNLSYLEFTLLQSHLIKTNSHNFHHHQAATLSYSLPSLRSREKNAKDKNVHLKNKPRYLALLSTGWLQNWLAQLLQCTGLQAWRSHRRMFVLKREKSTAG